MKTVQTRNISGTQSLETKDLVPGGRKLVPNGLKTRD